MKAHKILVIIIFLFYSINSFSQRKTIVEKRYIFVLDITKSMCGYGGSPDILDEVVSQLIEAINNINDPYAEIYLSTFQDEIINAVSVTGNDSGKKELVSFLKGIKCNELEITYTNIYSAWNDFENQLDDKKMNIVFLLTDGEHNSKKISKDSLLDKIKQWNNKSKEYSNGAYVFFVELTDEAIDPQIRNATEGVNNLQIINGIEFFILEIKDSYQIVNIDEEMSIKIDLLKNYWKDKYNNIKINLNIDSQYFRLDKTELKISDLPSIIKLVPKGDITSIKRNLNTESLAMLSLSYDEKKYPQVKLLDKLINVQINNKKEKVLYLEVVE